MENIPMIAAGAGLFGHVRVYAVPTSKQSKIDNGVDDITSEIQDGAMAFLLYRVWQFS